MMEDQLLRDALRIIDRYAVTLPQPDLRSARAELENHLEDEHGVHRDDVSEICQKIDDVWAGRSAGEVQGPTETTQTAHDRE
jgi:hypothetical protein